MKNYKKINIIKNFDPKGHRYKNNSMARSFGLWWAELFLNDKFKRLDKIVAQWERDSTMSILKDEAREIASGYKWIASNSDILTWFDKHGTRRHRQLIKAYMLLPDVRLIY